MRTLYFSRISIPLWTAIWSFTLSIAWLTAFRNFSVVSFYDRPLQYLPMIFLILFLLLIFLGTHYKVNDDQLIIKVGPLRIRTIKIQDISSIERTYELLASPANALRRLRINYRDTYLLISPSHEKEFIKHLKSINPDMQVGVLEKSIKF